MRFLVGLVTKQNADCLTETAALAWYDIQPTFNPKGMPLDFMRQRLLSVVKVTHANPIKSLNAALRRVTEKLFIRGLIANPEYGDPPLRVITQPKYRKHKLLYPFKTAKQHWLLTGARRALDIWPEGSDG